MHSIQEWAYAHPELAIALVTAIVNSLFAMLKLFSAKSKYVAFVAKLVAAIFPDPAEVVEAFRKLLMPPPPPAGPSRKETLLPPSRAFDELPTRPTLDRRSLRALAALAGVCLSVASCLPAKDVHDLLQLSKDEIQCVMASEGEDAATVATTCGIRGVPDLLQLVADLITTRDAARKSGVVWITRADAGVDASK